MAGQIARAVSVFQVDEVIIFDESGEHKSDTTGEFTGVKKKGNPNQTLARILRKSESAAFLKISPFSEPIPIKDKKLEIVL